MVRTQLRSASGAGWRWAQQRAVLQALLLPCCHWSYGRARCPNSQQEGEEITLAAGMAGRLGRWAGDPCGHTCMGVPQPDRPAPCAAATRCLPAPCAADVAGGSILMTSTPPSHNSPGVRCALPYIQVSQASASRCTQQEQQPASHPCRTCQAGPCPWCAPR